MLLLQVTRLESQVNRYKQTAEMGEKTVEELKVEKRRLQKEVGWNLGGRCCEPIAMTEMV